MSDSVKTPVTVLGLGAMGAALARALLAAGHPTTVWNRSIARTEPLVAEGATGASTPAEAIEASPLLIACLLDDASVREVLDPARETLAGRTLVNLTTSTPDQARDLAAWVAARNVAGFLDGGIMAIPPMIGGPEAFVLYSGSRESFRAHEGVLSALGAATYVGEDPGHAALYDLALLSGMYPMFAGFLQAVALVDAEGVRATEFTSSLLVPWLRAMTGAMPEMAEQIDSGDYTTEDSTLAMQTSGTSLAEFSESLGVSGELLEPMERLMKRRVAQGHGGDDVSSVFELIRSRSRAR